MHFFSIMRLRYLVFASLFFYALYVGASERPDIPDAAELQLMFKKLTVLGSALYVGAHPDDENTATLSYLSLNRLLRTAYLSLNRGEGGQNLIGQEQGELLGIIRTQELLAARNIDHAEQFFTRAVDFGFSKNPEEALRIWGKERVLGDVVWVIRNFRPDVILLRFTPAGGGHGHHTASAILGVEAFHAAADPKQFPDQLRYVQPWEAKRVAWNLYTWGQQQPTEEQKAAAVAVPLGEYNPFLGKSYAEIAGISRSMHKSQGMGDSEDRGPFTNYFQVLAGEPAKTDLFEGVDLSWNRIAGGSTIGRMLTDAYNSYNPEKPSASIPLLLKAYDRISTLKDSYWVKQKQKDVAEVIRGCAGLWVEGIASDAKVTPGSDLKIKTMILNRSDFPIQIESIALSRWAEKAELNIPLANNSPANHEFQVTVPENEPYSQPYWLHNDSSAFFANVQDQQKIGMPESDPVLQARFTVKFGEQKVQYDAPVLYRWIDPIRGELYRDVEVVPEVAINLKQPLLVFSDEKSRKLQIILTAGKDDVSGNLRVKLPAGWKVTPDSIPFQIKKRGEQLPAVFSVESSSGAATGKFVAEVLTESKTISSGQITIDYPHFFPQTLFPPSEGKVVRVNLKKEGNRLGYIMGPGDDIPQSLEQIGYQIKLLSTEDLATSDLSIYDAIITGIRAYNSRPDLPGVQSRLMEYVHNGGTLITQFQTLSELPEIQLGPYPFRISRDRVSVEDSAVSILLPDHLLLNHPNKITADDFSGWVQERGVYFPDQWDERYEAPLAMSDPGEPAKAGSLLFTRYGKGVYIFTSLSWFRQLPAGVPGAYRIFTNLLSAGNENAK